MKNFKLKLDKEVQEDCGFVLKEFTIQYFSNNQLISEFGDIKYAEFNIKSLVRFINEYKQDWLDVFCEVFDVMDEEAKAITSMIKDEDTRYLYIQKIDLGYKRGMGIGKEVLDIIKEDNPLSEIILYPYPIPTRWQLGFDEKYMEESKSKIIDFYKNNGFDYDSIKNVAILNA